MNRLFELEKELAQYSKKGQQHTLNSPANAVSTAQSLRGGFSKAMGKEKRKTVILSLDGGGIRGILPVMILAHLDNLIQKHPKNSRNIVLQDLVDVFAGTSTGGIIAAGLSLPPNKTIGALKNQGDLVKINSYYNQNPTMGRYKFSPKDLIEFYVADGPKIFTPKGPGVIKTKYDKAFLESSLKASFSEGGTSADFLFGELMKPCLITAVNFTLGVGKVFSTGDADDRKLSARNIVAATASAPTYFSPAQFNGFEYIDGGLLENNPAMIAFNEVCFNYKNLLGGSPIQGFIPPRKDSKGLIHDDRDITHPDDIIVVSLGTGDVAVGQKSLIRAATHGVSDTGKVFWAAIVSDELMSISANWVHERLKKQCAPGQYFRIDPKLSENIDLAVVGAMLELKTIANNYIRDKSTELDKIANLLLENFL